MATAEALPPDASTASTGLGLRYIGDYVWAASGEIADAASGGANSTLFDFSSGTGVIIATINFGNSVSVNNQTFLALNYNGLNVMAFDNDAESTFNTQPVELQILIPPFTEVTLKWGCNANEEGYAFLVGRVYEP